jgi:hypothetical protein
VNAEFNIWLLIVGLVVGAGLVWLVIADSRRREDDVTERERDSEARWISESMISAGRPISEGDARDILRLHAAYLAASPPDELDELDDVGAAADTAVGTDAAVGAERAPGSNAWRDGHLRADQEAEERGDGSSVAGAARPAVAQPVESQRDRGVAGRP